MERVEVRSSVIVMVEADNSNDRNDIHKWFEDSRFNVFDAINIFDALEAVSDFTVRDRPDVVLLNVDCCDNDLPLIFTTFAAASPDANPQILGVKTKLDGWSGESCCKGDLAHVAARLDRLIPERSLSVN